MKHSTEKRGRGAGTKREGSKAIATSGKGSRDLETVKQHLDLQSKAIQKILNQLTEMSPVHRTSENTNQYKPTNQPKTNLKKNKS